MIVRVQFLANPKIREINLEVATLESMAKLQKEHPFIILEYR